MVRIYHHPGCSTSRQTLSILMAHGVDVEVIEYLKHPPSAQALKGILEKLGLGPQDVIRKKEPLYKQRFDGQAMSDNQWIRVIVQNPILLERPIVVKDDTAVLGRPPENVLSLLSR